MQNVTIDFVFYSSNSNELLKSSNLMLYVSSFFDPSQRSQETWTENVSIQFLKNRVSSVRVKLRKPFEPSEQSKFKKKILAAALKVDDRWFYDSFLRPNKVSIQICTFKLVGLLILLVYFFGQEKIDSVFCW